jgi:hypothetical protein
VENFFYDKSTLNTHLSKVHGPNKYKKCDICDFYFKYLNKHKKRCSLKRIEKHNQINNKQKLENFENKYKKIRLTKKYFTFQNYILGMAEIIEFIKESICHKILT